MSRKVNYKFFPKQKLILWIYKFRVRNPYKSLINNQLFISFLSSAFMK